MIETKEFDLHGNEDDINTFLAGLNTETISENDAESVLEWARQVTVQHGMLQGIMSGMTQIVGWVDGEPRFGITEKGRDYVENTLLNPWPDVVGENHMMTFDDGTTLETDED